MSGPRAASRRSRRRRSQASLRERALVDMDRWRRALARHRCESVYHLTPLANLRSILLNGLLSRAELRRCSITVVPHSSGHIPHATARFDDYCLFSLAQFHWRLAATSDEPYVGLVMPANAVLVPGTLFVLNDVELNGAIEGHPHEAFEELWTHRNSTHLRGQVEAWVPGSIGAEVISEVKTTASTLPAVRRMMEVTRLVSSRLPRIVVIDSFLS